MRHEQLEIVHTCDSCCMPGFCASIVLDFISGVELFDHVVDEGNLREPGWGRKPNGDMASRWGGIKPSGRHNI